MFLIHTFTGPLLLPKPVRSNPRFGLFPDLAHIVGHRTPSFLPIGFWPPQESAGGEFPWSSRGVRGSNGRCSRGVPCPRLSSVPPFSRVRGNCEPAIRELDRGHDWADGTSGSSSNSGLNVPLALCLDTG